MSNATSQTLGIEEKKDENGVQVISKKLISFREHSKDSDGHLIEQDNAQIQSRQKPLNGTIPVSAGPTIDQSHPVSQKSSMRDGAQMLPA